jgi:hypothetical protein
MALEGFGFVFYPRTFGFLFDPFIRVIRGQMPYSWLFVDFRGCSARMKLRKCNITV